MKPFKHRVVFLSQALIGRFSPTVTSLIYCVGLCVCAGHTALTKHLELHLTEVLEVLSHI